MLNSNQNTAWRKTVLRKKRQKYIQIWILSCDEQYAIERLSIDNDIRDQTSIQHGAHSFIPRIKCFMGNIETSSISLLIRRQKQRVLMPP